MRSKLFLGCAASLALFATVHSVAQSVKPDAATVKADLQTMVDAAKFRQAAARSLVDGSESAAAAIVRLKAYDSPSGLKIDRDADIGFALVDVGQRLIAASKLTEAEEFFQEAERYLALMAEKTPDSASSEKVQYLSKLALIRASYLNKPAQAKADLDAARELRPDDKYLDGLRDVLRNEHGDIFAVERKR